MISFFASGWAIYFPVIFFFFTIFIGLFFGDGRQSFIEPYMAVCVILLSTLITTHKQLRILPWNVERAWILLCGYYLVSLLWSGCAMCSMHVLARLLMGFAVFRLWYGLASRGMVHFFARWLLYLVLMAIVAAIIMVIFPTLREYLLPMNLLYASFGHNHVASLILLVVPLATAGILSRPTVPRLAIWVILMIALLLSFARLAILVSIGYFVLVVISKKHFPSVGRVHTLLYGVVVAASAVLLGVAFFSTVFSEKQMRVRNHWLLRQLVKSPLTADGRVQYWKSAIDSIAYHPLFGSGPGTYGLESLRLSNNPSETSWLTHSFPLEIVVESGLVGGVFWFLLYWEIYQMIKRVYGQLDAQKRSCLVGVFALYLVSLADITFNFLILFLLSWSMIGIVLGRTNSNYEN